MADDIRIDDIRIKDMQSTASYMESDDYLPIDGLALGNRKIPFTGLMDSEDDRLPTTDKTPRGAITEHEGDISEIKQSLSDLHLQYDTLLNNQDTTTTETSYNLSSGKKFSDYQILIFEQRYDVSDTRFSIMIQGIGWVTGRVLYLNCLHGSTAASASTYNVSGITVKYNSDTSFKAQATGAAGVKKVSIFGIKLNNR